MFKWIKGRQNTGYEKLKIFQFLNMDCYLLRYKVGDSIPWHTDPVPGRKHFRANFELIKAKLGGEFIVGTWAQNPEYEALCVYSENNRMIVFRSDIIKHCVTEIEKGSRIVLTFGIAI